MEHTGKSDSDAMGECVVTQPNHDVHFNKSFDVNAGVQGQRVVWRNALGRH